MKNYHLPMIVLTLLLAFLAGGCSSFRPLQIEPVAKKKAIVRPDVRSATYRADRDNNLYFILKSNNKDRASGEPVEQTLIIRMFWRPVGGKTSLEPSALNCTYRYIVTTPSAEGMYEGAGLLRVYDKIGKRMDARLVDGDLRLSEATENFVDSLGRCRIYGNFTADFAEAKTMSDVIEAQRGFFARSLPGALVQYDDHGQKINTTQPANTQPAKKAE